MHDTVRLEQAWSKPAGALGVEMKSGKDCHDVANKRRRYTGTETLRMRALHATARRCMVRRNPRASLAANGIPHCSQHNVLEIAPPRV